MFKGMIKVASLLALVVLAGTFQLSMAQGGLGSLSGRVTDSTRTAPWYPTPPSKQSTRRPDSAPGTRECLRMLGDWSFVSSPNNPELARQAGGESHSYICINFQIWQH